MSAYNALDITEVEVIKSTGAAAGTCDIRLSWDPGESGLQGPSCAKLRYISGSIIRILAPSEYNGRQKLPVNRDRALHNCSKKFSNSSAIVKYQDLQS